MIKGEKIRFDIHNILYSINKHNTTLNNINLKKLIQKYNKADVAFINNVTLNSMRFNIHTNKITNKYIKKKLKNHERILLTSAITQIVFLNFKEYAVINCSVEIAKKLKIYPGLINATLKNIAKDKSELKNIKIKFEDLPTWFKVKTISLSNYEKNKFLNNYFQEPDMHIAFKNKDSINNFEEKLIKTSDVSGFLKNKKNITDKKSFKRGDWWVQDFSSFFPLHNLQIKDHNKNILDACSAPGGKSFQLLSKGFNVTLNDKSKSRIKILRSNLKRLRLKCEIFNNDFTKFEESKNYDLIIIDAPCSAVGTIRKNPEIFFKNKGPDFENLVKLQEDLLQKATNMLTQNGLILYMVCSFLNVETTDQVERFLKKNKRFQLSNFKLIQENSSYSNLIRNNFMITLPNTIFNNHIDGYFAAVLKKIK